ncbi:hypothetical protein QN277_021140 [Acacia crassicarpa]|uniref:Uncharacterized protein n=1 Tax=Acacia crassicarpa TaxID=499986 RepID=A0AAE1JPJ5_9FABA|nr:hypothetical protein QN277_021140 [Acacia crassicarpa]
MSSVSFGSFHLISPPIFKSHPRLQIKCQHIHHLSCNGFNMFSTSLASSFSKPILLRATGSNFDAPISFPEGAVSVVNFEELMEKDWSVLDSDKSSPDEEFSRNIDRIISAGKIEETSRVLVSISSEEFVDRLVGSCPCKFLLIVHDSLLMLAGIKEKYDLVKCWQGEIIYVPENWAPLDVVFLYFLPALPFKLDEILGSLAKKCSPGGRVVISHPQGREVLKKQRQEHPEVVVSDLPDKTTLQRLAVAHSYNVTEFVDEPGLYLAVLSRIHHIFKSLAGSSAPGS